MIFVSVGTNEAPFDRLVQALEAIGGDEELVVQTGASGIRPSNARCVDFMPFDEVVDHVRRARVFVTHAGVGSVTVGLSAGKRPVVVPRLRAHGEAVDDHQVAFARRFDAAGLVTLVEDPDDLAAALASAPAEGPPPAERPRRLGTELREYLSVLVAAR